MKFGLLKTKIEKCLTESYENGTFKKDVFLFKELVLNNKNVSKLYYLYDELSKNKGLNESLGSEYINQSTIIYENIINKIDKLNLKELALWLGHVKSGNNYNDIDNLFSPSVVNLEEKIKSKKTILENLKKQPVTEEETPKVPMDKMVKVANKTVNDYISTLGESDKKKLTSILNESNDKLFIKYDVLKETVIEKLEDLKSDESNNEVLGRITETINKVQKESFDKLSYFKLLQLNKNL
jgi:hypothetical protein